VIEDESVAQLAAIAASFSHGGEHRVVPCGDHWHVQRVGRG